MHGDQFLSIFVLWETPSIFFAKLLIHGFDLENMLIIAIDVYYKNITCTDDIKTVVFSQSTYNCREIVASVLL